MEPVVHDIRHFGITNGISVTLAPRVPDRIESEDNLSALANDNVVGQVSIDCERKFAGIMHPVLQHKCSDLAYCMNARIGPSTPLNVRSFRRSFGESIDQSSLDRVRVDLQLPTAIVCSIIRNRYRKFPRHILFKYESILLSLSYGANSVAFCSAKVRLLDALSQSERRQKISN